MSADEVARLQKERDTLALQIAQAAANREAVPEALLSRYVATQKRLTALVEGAEQ